MLFTFQTPWDMTENCRVIKDTIAAMNGKVREKSPGYLKGKWRIRPDHKMDFYLRCKFYVGDNLVRAIIKEDIQYTTIRKFRRLTKEMKLWNTFIEYLLKLHPGVEFGLTPGVPTISAVRFYGDGTEMVYTSTTQNSPSLSGALVGGMLFGEAGAIIGSTKGHSHTTGTSHVAFAKSVLAQVRYSSGLILEGSIDKSSKLYQEIMVNLNRLSNDSMVN